MPDNEKTTMWNGGTTNDKTIKEWNKMIRQSEDYLDGMDIDVDKEFNPRDNINKNMMEPAKISHGEPRNRYRRPEGQMVGVKNDNNE